MAADVALTALKERLGELNQSDGIVAFDEVRGLLALFPGEITVRDLVAFRAIAIRQINLLELSATVRTAAQQNQLLALWRGADAVFEQQMATVLPVEKMTEIDELLTKQANLESLERLIGRLGTLAESEPRQVRGRSHRNTGRVGWLLIVLGAASLLFGWPWGALVGAVLVLAGVLALQTRT